MIVKPIVSTTWMTLQAFSNTPHDRVASPDDMFGMRTRPNTALHLATKLQYKNSVDSYTEESSSTSSPLAPLVVEDDVNVEEFDWMMDEVDEGDTEPNVITMLQSFRVMESFHRVTYPHFLETVDTWGRKKHIRRREKFVDLLNPVQKDSLERVFALVDQDEDNSVDMFDIRSVLDSVRVVASEEEEPPKLGLNGFKKMSKEEFMGLSAEAEFYHLLRQTFATMDLEGNGYVRVADVSDLLHGLKSICTSFDCDARLEELIHGKTSSVEARPTKDRYVFYQDFIQELLGMRC